MKGCSWSILFIDFACSLCLILCTWSDRLTLRHGSMVVLKIMVVILGIRRLTSGRTGMPAHYTGRKLGVLDIFSEYSLKIPRIYSNMLKYTRIYLIFPCRAGSRVVIDDGHGGKDVV
jgi:hypothetical protein